MEEEVLEQQPTEPEYTGDQNAVEEGAEVETPSEEQAQPGAYTEAELLEVLKSDGVLDRNRMTPEMLAIQKTFEKGLTPKFQEAAEARRKGLELQRQAEEILRQAQVAQQMQDRSAIDPREKIYQQYLANPLGITKELNDAIAQLEGAPFSEENRLNIARLNATKEEFRLRREQEIENQRNQSAFRQTLQNLNATVEMDLQREIPDLRERVPKLNEFATSKGFTPEVLQVYTNPAILELVARQMGMQVSGAEAVKQFAKFMNSQYEALNPTKKQVKQTPKALERSGSGGTGKAGPNMQRMMERAQETGDWTEYLKAKGALKM